jgi:hypothetical protein
MKAANGNRRQDAEKMDKEIPRNEKRSFNCSQRNHADYLSKMRREPRYFKCDERGHIASKYVK